MKTEEIIEFCKSTLHDKVEDNSHMYLWVTNTFLPDGLKLMEQLGFRYITNLCWYKNKIGIGRYFRGKHELCLFGTKGNGFSVRTEHNDIPGAFSANKTQHSKKPIEMYQIIEKRSIGPYLEIFARNTRDNWESVGNEIEKFGEIND